ncbi:MAG: sugar phosphate nucleotidyltransferase, partial [Armatimonadota bacterium]
LVPILDRPMIEHIICGAREAGFDHLCLIVAYKGDMICDYLGDGSRLGVRIEYVWQEGPAGTGAATLMAEDFVGEEPFFLSWGDIIVGPKTYQNVARAWAEERPRAVLSLNWVEDPCEGAAVYVDEDGYITEIVEKPERGTSTTHFNNAGIFVFGSELFAILKGLPDSPRGEKEMPDAVKELMAQGAKIRGLEVDGYWSDVARPSTVLSLNSTLIRHREPSGIIIDPTAMIGAGCTLEPPLYIGPGCRLRGCHVGPDAVLVRDVLVEKGARITDAMCLGGNRVAASAVLTHVILEENADVELGATLKGEPATPAVRHKA